jgi:hypothetical protein
VASYGGLPFLMLSERRYLYKLTLHVSLPIAADAEQRS